jgi:hypothetical protein
VKKTAREEATRSAAAAQKNEWESLAAQESRKDDVDHERSEEDVTKQCPSAVYTLSNGIVRFRKPHFVRKGKQMSASQARMRSRSQ